MAGEQAYINPIINSIVESSRQQLTKQQMAQQAEQFKAEQALRQQHQGMLEKQLENEHNIALQRLDIERALKEAQQESTRVNALENLYKLSAAGGDLSKLRVPGTGMSGNPAETPGMIAPQIEGQLQVPGTNFRIPEGLIPSPQQILQFREQEARNLSQAQAGGAAAGTAPYQLSLLGEKHKQAMEVKQMELASRLQNTVLQGKNQLEVAKIHGAYQNANAQINGAYHLKGIAMANALGFGEDQANGAKQLMDGVFDGTIDPSKLTMPRKKLLEAYASGTGELASLPLDFKNYKARLDNMSSLQGLIDEYRVIANNYSQDSPGSGEGGNKYVNLGKTIGTHGFVVPGSELASKLAAVKSEGGTIAAFFDKMTGRRSEAEVLRETSGWFNPAFTKQQNLDMIEQHVKRLQRDVRGLFTGMSSERVNKILGDRGVTDFGAFPTAAAVSKLNEGEQEGRRYKLPDGSTVVYRHGKYVEE